VSERSRPKKMIRERLSMSESALARARGEYRPREQVAYRDGKPTVITLRCRLHNEPWLTCASCSKPSR